MGKIPTAEEFIKSYLDINKNEESHFNKLLDKDNYDVMIEFAKLHVEAAIKECIESAPSGSSTDTVSYSDVEKALKDCYSLTNIK
jgi:hypothetical protein